MKGHQRWEREDYKVDADPIVLRLLKKQTKQCLCGEEQPSERVSLTVRGLSLCTSSFSFALFILNVALTWLEQEFWWRFWNQFLCHSRVIQLFVSAQHMSRVFEAVFGFIGFFVP